MELIEVKDKATAKLFIKVPVHLYRTHNTWIRPLDKDIEEVFDPEQNRLFRQGDAKRWILKNGKGDLLGRIAAFVNPKTARKQKQPTGGIGFFECINNQEAANTLIDAAVGWLKDKGMEAADGPVNFGERDKWWGCLIDGFDIEPNYCCNYNYPYYKDLFEKYGFREYFQQYTYSRPVQGEVAESYYLKAERISRDPKYTFRHIEPDKLEKYAEDFLSIYNKAWVKHEGVGAMKRAQAVNIFKKMKPVLDKDIVWFAYYDEEPAGFFIMLPELNQLFKYVNGKLDLIGKLKFVYHKWRGSCRKMFGVVFGIIPAHQGKGLEGAIVMAVKNHVQPQNRYDIFEMNWIGDFNPKMMKVSESVGGSIVKRHATYRLLFDPNAPFERAPVMD